MEVEQAAEVSSGETTGLKSPDKTPVRKYIPNAEFSCLASNTITLAFS